MLFKLIGCEVLSSEFRAAASKSPHHIDVQFLTRDFNDGGCPVLPSHVQSVLDAVDPLRYDAVLLGFAVCGRSAVGLSAAQLPLVMPRALNCAHLLNSEANEFSDFSNEDTGFRWASTKWLVRTGEVDPLGDAALDRPGMSAGLPELVQRYGEEHGRYLYQELRDCESAYTRLTFVQTGRGARLHFVDNMRNEVARRGLQPQPEAQGASLIEQLLNGDWDPKYFLKVRPGERVALSDDEHIIRAEPYQ